MIFTFPSKSFSPFSFRSESIPVNSGALSPTFSSGPMSVTGFPKMVTIFFLSMVHLPLVSLFFIFSMMHKFSIRWLKPSMDRKGKSKVNK